MGFLYENKEKSNQLFVAYKNSNFNKKNGHKLFV